MWTIFYQHHYGHMLKIEQMAKAIEEKAVGSLVQLKKQGKLHDKKHLFHLQNWGVKVEEHSYPDSFWNDRWRILYSINLQ